MTDLVLGALGLIMAFVAMRELRLSFRHSTFRVRGGRLLRRRNHPVIFWINVVGISIFGVAGCVSACKFDPLSGGIGVQN
ncbi:MAG TPA: hypothetical protein VGI09_07085 [Pseudolabrys sp.]